MQGEPGHHFEAIVDELLVFGKHGAFDDSLSTISFVVEKRMPDMLEMDPDLVRPACLKMASNQARIVE